jgi:hypothetical protein
MVITEEELRQAWQNGRGTIPSFPPGTRFTPAAQDFLKARGPAVLQACAAALPAPVQAAAQRRELRAPAGRRQIFTAADVAELLAGGGSILVVHPSVTVTHAALELLRKAGIRIIPYVEPAANAPEAAAPAAPDAAPGASEEETIRRVKEAVLARLGKPVDPAVLDAVLRRVLAAL